MHPLAKLDHRYVWHPFTQMRDWVQREPIILVEARGAVLRDVHGKEYLDANSSIWTNLHGHNHPKLNNAIKRQLGRVAHTSALGFANEPASLLGERLVKAAKPADPRSPGLPRAARSGPLQKVFFSDDGSTAMEVAIKLAYEFARRSGLSSKPRFLTLQGAYHGDTVGAVSLGHIDLFHKAYSGLLFRTDHVPAPYCYRCPFNRAKPERADARLYRKCEMQCLPKLEEKLARKARGRDPYAAFVFEPLMQGAAGMIAQPEGWLEQAARVARAHGALLIADEVMTGFGRTGSGIGASPSLFACQNAGVRPDFLALAKGLTGGYLPMAATLTTERVFKAFLGRYEEFKTFFHGHSFTGNQLGAAAALASLDLLQNPKAIAHRRKLETALSNQLQTLWACKSVGDSRQVGLVAGIELVKDWRTREPFPLSERAGIRVCETMAREGVLTRPIGNVVAIMPPYCTTLEQLETMFDALRSAINSL